MHDVDAGAFNGQALWLAVTVDGQLLTPRQELLPAPYALSVRPGAKVVGNTSEPILTVHNDNNVGIWASSDNESPLVGKIDNTDSSHSAVAGLTDGAGNGMFGLSAGGYGMYGHTIGEAAWKVAGVYGSSVHDNTFGVLGVSEWGIGLEGKIDNPENGNPAIVGFSLGDGPAIYAYGRDNTIPDVVHGGDDEQDDGLLTSDLGHPSSDIIVASNDAVVVALDDNNDEDGHFVVVNGEDAVTFSSDEQGNTEVKGDLTVEGNLKTSGPTCAQYGPYTEEDAYNLPVPAYCIDQMCWIVVQGDAIIGAFSPGLYWPVLYMQDSAGNDWVGGPPITLVGMTISDGTGRNGDNTLNIIASSGTTAGGGKLILWDDGAGVSSPDSWYLDFKPYRNELSTATVYACPMGRPEIPLGEKDEKTDAFHCIHWPASNNGDSHGCPRQRC